jgi:hypothetical protein
MLIDLVAAHAYEVVVTLSCFVVSLLVATVVVQAGLRRLRLPDAAVPRDAPSTGFWIGSFETVLIGAAGGGTGRAKRLRTSASYDTGACGRSAAGAGILPRTSAAAQGFRSASRSACFPLVKPRKGGRPSPGRTGAAKAPA